MNSEKEMENNIFTAFIDQIKKDAELRELLKSTKKRVHVICVKADMPLADRLKVAIEELADRGKEDPYICVEESTVNDVLDAGQDPHKVGSLLKRTEDIYIFIAPQIQGMEYTREQVELLTYTKGAFSPGGLIKAEMIAICPSSERNSFQAVIYDNQLKLLDSSDAPASVIAKMKNGLRQPD